MTIEVKFYDTPTWPQKRLYRTRPILSYNVVHKNMNKDDVPYWIDKILRRGGYIAQRIRGKIYIIDEYPPEYDEVMRTMEKAWEKCPDAIIDFMVDMDYNYCPDCEHRGDN